MQPPSPRAPQLPQRQKRYGWFRLYEDFPNHPKWRLVAAKSGVPLVSVKAFVLDLFCKASKARARGHLGDIDFHEIAIANDAAAEQVASVYKVLVDIGWIEDDFIVDWLDRQPDHEDPTAKERQRNKRARDRATRAKMMGVATEVDELILSRVTPAPAAEPVPQRPVEHVEPLRILPDNGSPDLKRVNEANARAWLFGDSVRDTGSASLIVAHQLGQRRMSADLTVRRWYGEIGRDAVALAEIIHGVHKGALDGAAFETMVDQRIKALVSLRENGPGLPMPPVAVKGGRRG